MDGTQATPSIEERLGAVLNPEPVKDTPAPAKEPRAQAQPDGDEEAPTVAPVEDANEEVEAEQATADVKEDDGDDGAIEVSSLSDLMEHFEVNGEDLYNLTIPVNINGKTENVTLGEYRDSIHHAEEAKRFQSEAKAHREEAESFRRKVEEQYQGQLAQGAALVQALEQQALEQFQGVNWDELRHSDPSEWSAKRMEMESAKARIDRVKAEVSGKIQDYQTQTERQRNEFMQERLRKEHKAFTEAWPEMGDEKKATAEKAKLIGELRHRGFSDEDIGNAFDHRLLLMARDAMLWRESGSKADAAKKKVLKIGTKVIKPGARVSRDQQRQDARKPLRDKLRKSGHLNDAAALLSQG